MGNSPKKLPFFFIGKSTTDKRKENFKKQKYPVLCNQLRKNDTLSIWYSREHISKLLEEIDNVNGDGIRLHFGAYESGHEFEGQLCLVMNVTRVNTNKNSQIREDINLEDEPDFKERSQFNRVFDQKNEPIFRDFNFGSPCPPRCHDIDGK